ncbi:MAG: tetratricopeptide repeat protein [Vampirovibrio sp.]|nr:tetratricopeptide repeat protein [Vampirovibrio sp.]
MSGPFTAEAGEISLHVKAARRYMDAQQWDYAGYEWRQALEQDNKNVEANLGLVDTLYFSGYKKEAVKHLEKAVRRMKNGRAFLKLAELYGKTGQYGSADRLYRKILKRQRFQPDAYISFHQMVPTMPKKYQKSRNAYLGTIAKDAREKALEAAKTHNYRQSTKYFAIANEHYQDAALKNDYGLALLFSGQYKKSFLIFRQLNNDTQDNWRTLANEAIAALALRNSYQAQRRTEKAIELVDDPAEKAKLYNNLGYVSEASKKFTRARYAYEHALELSPSFLKARQNLAYILQRMQDYDTALTVYKDIYKRTDDVDAMVKMGFVYELQHEDKKAESTYKKAISKDRKFKDAYYNLGLLYKKLGKMEKSSDAFKQLTELEFEKIENPEEREAKDNTPPLYQFIDAFYSPIPQTTTATAHKKAKSPVKKARSNDSRDKTVSKTDSKTVSQKAVSKKPLSKSKPQVKKPTPKPSVNANATPGKTSIQKSGSKKPIKKSANKTPKNDKPAAPPVNGLPSQEKATDKSEVTAGKKPKKLPVKISSPSISNPSLSKFNAKPNSESKPEPNAQTDSSVKSVKPKPRRIPMDTLGTPENTPQP